MGLVWTVSEPKPSPFEAVSSDTIVFEVNTTESTSTADSELSKDIGDVVCKALLFAEMSTGPRAKKILILWDAVYCGLTIVFTDDTMMLDSNKVTKCTFVGLDAQMWKIQKDSNANWVQEANALSIKIRELLIDNLQRNVLCAQSLGMPILFSDEDRSSTGVGQFIAEELLS